MASTRLKEDILYQLRSLENELKIYEKQTDVLFATLNSFVSNQTRMVNACLVDQELEWASMATKAEAILNDQMVPHPGVPHI